jgi:ATP-binding cassette, subfamily B, bacterial MsbA
MKKVFTILKHIRDFKKQIVLVIVFNVFSGLFGSISVAFAIPFLDMIFRPDTDYGAKTLPEFSFNLDYFLDTFSYYLGQVITSRGQLWAIALLCGLMVSTTFIKTGTRYLTVFYIAPIRSGIVERVRNNLFNKVLKLPLSFYSEERKGDIISKISSDVNEIQLSVVSSIEAFINNPFILLFNLVLLIAISPLLTLFVIVLLPLSGYFIGRIGKTLKNPAYKGQVKLGEILSTVEETLTGLRIIKAFNNEDKTEQKFRNFNSIYTRLTVKINRRRGLSSPLSEFLGTIVIVCILLFGSWLIISKTDVTNLTASKMIAYIGIFYLIINPAKAFSNAYYNVQKGLASIERINQIIDADISIKDAPDAIEKSGFENQIEYKSVSFRYIDEWVLQDINLVIEKGKAIAVVGASGSGKSTLADILPRLIEQQKGQILIDGIDTNKIKIHDLRNLLGIVTQQSILFNDTVYNNIAFGLENPTEEKVIEAAKVANAHEFITQMPQGYYTNIGDMGNKLSGGQRQRLTIARAIFKNPPILILDEATSALDTESEKLVQEALFNLMKNRTSIVIAHRLSTIKESDEIIVLDQGRIIERGKHSELLKARGHYKKLVDLQKFSE